MLCAIFIFISVFNNFAQYNLVPNYSFESYAVCPSSSSLYDVLNNKPDFWYKPDKRGAAYCNSCASLISNIGVPDNRTEGGHSFQYAKTGVAYIGMFYFNGPSSNQRNYFQVKLIDSLRKGRCYYAECFVNLADSQRYASNNQSMLFTNAAIYADTAAGIAVIPANPQITNYNNPVIKDTQQWVKVSGIFTAQGGEQYLTLGNFKYDNQTNYQQVLVNFNSTGAVYYVDDVSVIPLDSLPLKADAGRDTIIAPGNSIYIGSYTNGLTNVNWLNSSGAIIATGVPGLTVTPIISTFYIIEQTVCGYYSRDTIHITVGALPLQFVSFTLNALSSPESVSLHWKTANEIAVSHFIIQNSSNGIYFNDVQKIVAKNRSFNEYSYIHSQPINGTNFYRIKAVDNDGKITYSKTTTINLNLKSLALNVYPNPVKNILHIKHEQLQEVIIYSIQGKQVKKIIANNMDIVSIDIRELLRGIYLVKVIGKNQQAQIKKIVVI